MNRAERNAELIRLYVDDKQSLNKLSERYDITPQGVRAVLLANGIKLRSPGGANHHKRKFTPEKEREIAERANVYGVKAAAEAFKCAIRTVIRIRERVENVKT